MTLAIYPSINSCVLSSGFSSLDSSDFSCDTDSVERSSFASSSSDCSLSTDSFSDSSGSASDSSSCCNTFSTSPALLSTAGSAATVVIPHNKEVVKNMTSNLLILTFFNIRFSPFVYNPLSYSHIKLSQKIVLHDKHNIIY